MVVSLAANLTHSRNHCDGNSVRASTQFVEDLHTVGARLPKERILDNV